MNVNRIWAILSALVCCLLAGCCSLSQPDLDDSYHHEQEDWYNEGYNEGHSEGYSHAYETAYEAAREELINELYSVDGYTPVYMDEELINALLYLVEEKNGNRYRPEEYAMIVDDYFSENYYNMSAEQIEAFEKILTYCADAEWITTNIAHDLQFPPS